MKSRYAFNKWPYKFYKGCALSVTAVAHSSRDFLLKLTLALNIRFISFLEQGQLKIFVEELLARSFKLNQKSAIGALDTFLSYHEIADGEREILFRRWAAGFNPSTIPQSFIDIFWAASGGSIHYSQEGEDILLERIFADKAQGFFVDVGAHHPTRFSNTFALYKRGWRGINIDATPGSMDAFRALRPDDINLEIAVSDRMEPLVLHVFKEGALNTLDPALSATYAAGGWERTGTIELQPRPLADVLGQYVPAGQAIDLLSIDVEGEDLGVLRSNDWEKYCPGLIIVEALDTPLTTLHTHPAITFLSEHGFFPMARLFNSVILRREDKPCAES